MSENYIGEIRTFSFGFVPKNWHLCDGTVLQIKQYVALYSLLGKYFGGDGITTFALPNLCGRTIMNAGRFGGADYEQGMEGGVESLSLTMGQTNHNHLMHVEAAQGDSPISTNMLAIPNVTSIESEVINIYSTASIPNTSLNPETIDNSGGGTAHSNMQPYTVVNYCIALNGYYPPRP
ncbi:phage tail protein [Bacteroides ihuae]|uniref:phage tail protein n=1 Tax=Bacteroides ihuae TaxID=1852362 RepID=UPI0008D928F2|nr:tail fiber protein [Bacteroides ihuae]